MTTTFAGLCDLAPELRRYAAEAVEAAHNGFPGWLSWLPTFSGFRGAVRSAADAAQMDPYDAEEIVLQHLGDVYQVEARRRERRREKRPA